MKMTGKPARNTALSMIVIAAMIVAGFSCVLAYAPASFAKAKKATIKVEQTSYKLKPDSPAFALEATTNSDGKLRYKSSDRMVVKVTKKGRVKVQGVGTATITVYVKATKKYKAAEETVNIRVAKEQILTPDPEEYEKLVGEDPFQITVRSNADPVKKMTYKSSDEEVLTVDESGMASPKSKGTAQVTVRSARTDEYYAASIKVPVTVTRGKQEIKTEKESYKVSLLDEKTNLNAAATSELALTYASSDKSIVKVTKKGRLTPVAVGTAQITIRQAGDENYDSAEKTVKVKIKKPTVEDRRNAAVAWAIKIAKDDTFTYGVGDRAHRYGCYFCGTNIGPNHSKKEKSGEKHIVKDDNGTEHTYEKTYCCNPFVHAAYAHGAKISTMLKACQKGSGVGLSADTFTRYGCWENIGKPGMSKLVPGDVFVKKGHHASLYCGDGYVAEAARSGWDAGSIPYHKKAKDRYKSCTYVMRYVGKKSEASEPTAPTEPTQPTDATDATDATN